MTDADRIPEPLWEQVLLRVPLKQVLNLRSVCKSWYSLITTHSYPLAMASESSPTPASNYLPLLVRFDSNSKHLALGFGFDSNNIDFKVIIVIGAEPRAELYSLNKATWRSIDSPFVQELGPLQFSDSRCFLNGNVHFIAASSSSRGGNVILTFDVEGEKFKKMELPQDLINVSVSELKVAVIHNWLHVIRYEHGDIGLCMMKDCGVSVSKSWIKGCHVRNRPLLWQVYALSSISGLSVAALQLKPDGENWGVVTLDIHDPNSVVVTRIGINSEKFSAWEYAKSLVLLDKEKDTLTRR